MPTGREEDQISPTGYNQNDFKNIDKLGSLIPQLLNESQLEIFQNKELLQSRLAYTINLTGIPSQMKSLDGQRITALSAGGSNLIKGDFIITNGKPELIRLTPLIENGHSGEGYFEYFKKIGQEAKEKNIPVGIAYAAAIDSNTGEILGDANLSLLRQAIDRYANGNINKYIPTLRIMGTDSTMGIIAGIVIAKTKNPQIAEGIDFINGTGTGMAIYKEEHGIGEIYSVIPEHRPVIEKLFPIKGYKDCKACLEEIISGSGIENIYFYATQNYLDGPSIGKLAKEKDPLALKLYAQSAYIGAHAIVGVGKRAFGLFAKPNKTALILEGSLCESGKVPEYSNLLIRTVEKNINGQPTVVYPEEQPVPLSLEGAAIAATMKCLKVL